MLVSGEKNEDFHSYIKKKKMVDLAVVDSASHHADNSAQAFSIYC